jgi:hypothetical protein
VDEGNGLENRRPARVRGFESHPLRCEQLFVFGSRLSALPPRVPVTTEARVEPATKPCRDCREHKPLDQFPLQKGGRWGRHPLCRRCRAAQERARYQRDREQILARHRENPVYKEKARWRQILRRRGATRDEYESMYAAQGGRCAICGDSHVAVRSDIRSLGRRWSTTIIERVPFAACCAAPATVASGSSATAQRCVRRPLTTWSEGPQAVANLIPGAMPERPNGLPC